MEIELPQQLLHSLRVSKKYTVKHLAGNANENVLVNDSNYSYVVKKLLEHSRENTELEGIYREYLNSSGFPVSKYIKFANNSYVETVNDANYVALEFVDGDSLKNLTEIQLESLASLIAEIHSLPSNNMLVRSNWLSSTYPIESRAKIESNFLDFAIELAQELEKYPNFWDLGLPRGIIHGDLHAGNLIFNEGQIVSIIDWEEVSVEPIILDLGGIIKAFCLDRHGSVDTKKLKLFLNSYLFVRELSDIEKQYLEDAVNYTQLVESVWAHLKYSQSELSKSKFEKFKDNYKNTVKLPSIWF